MKQFRLSFALRSFCFILSCVTFLSIFPCSVVKASDFAEQIGIEQELFDSMLEEDKTITFNMPYTLEETGNYIIQEDIKLNSTGYEFYWEHKPYITYTSYGTSILPFGTTKIVTNSAEYVRITLYNDNKLLFSQSGSLYLKLVAYSTKGTLRLTRVGDYVNEIGIATDPSDVNAMIELQINNTLNDLVKVEIILDGPVKQGSGDNYLAGGIVKYGYVFTTSSTGDNSKNIFDLLKGFVNGFWQNTMGSISNVFSFLVNFVSSFWGSFTSKLQSGYDYLSDKVSGLFQYLKDFVLGFWNSLSVSLETALDYLTDKISVLFQYFKDFVLDFWNSFSEKVTDLFQYFKDFVLDFWYSFTEKLESGFDYLTNKIYDLFLPPRGYIKNWINAYYGVFTDKMGAFGYIHNYIIELFTVFYSYDFKEPTLTLPEISFTVPNYGTYVICEERHYNLNYFNELLPIGVSTLHFGTSVLMTFWLVSYSRKVVNDILR